MGMMQERTTADRIGRAVGAFIVWGVLLTLLYGALAPYRFGLIVGGGAMLGAWVAFNERRIKIHNHSPTPPQNPSPEEKQQFRIVQGDHPHHWKIRHGGTGDDE